MAGHDAVSESEGARERLEPEDAHDGSLLAASHLHRYEFAAELCDGMRVLDLCCGTGYGSALLARRAASVHGVDVASAAIATAQALVAPEDGHRMGFETADALEHLRASGTTAYDVIVCFEGLEHVPDPDAVLAEIARFTKSGARAILSFPNSRGFDEENEFHVTSYGWERVQTVASDFPDALLLSQYLAEGSWISCSGAADATDVAGRLVGQDDAAPEWANHWVLLIGFDAAATIRARARMALAVAPAHNAYMHHLERANAALRTTNARLSRSWLGVHDAAAASVVRRMQDELDAVKVRARHARTEAERWERIAGNNDWGRRQLAEQLAQPRYLRMDAVRDRLIHLPGAKALWRLLG